eukprot:994953-Prorocentrum_minimum.AAC.3
MGSKRGVASSGHALSGLLTQTLRCVFIPDAVAFEAKKCALHSARGLVEKWPSERTPSLYVIVARDLRERFRSLLRSSRFLLLSGLWGLVNAGVETCGPSATRGRLQLLNYAIIAHGHVAFCPAFPVLLPGVDSLSRNLMS